MAVSEPRRATGGGDADGTDDPEVDIRLTPIYRFLRVLVHGINRLFFRTSVEGAGRVPGRPARSSSPPSTGRSSTSSWPPR